MKLILTLLAKDEEDIIRGNILFHLNHGVDFIIAPTMILLTAQATYLMSMKNRECLKLYMSPEMTIRNEDGLH